MPSLRTVTGHRADVIDRGEVLGTWADVLKQAAEAARIAASRCETAQLPNATADDHLVEAEMALQFALVRVTAARRS